MHYMMLFLIDVGAVHIQVTTLPDEFPDAHSIANDLRLEYVIAVEGVVRSRPTESVNKKMTTGMIEVGYLFPLLLDLKLNGLKKMKKLTCCYVWAQVNLLFSFLLITNFCFYIIYISP